MLQESPGRIFLLATLAPLAAAVLLFCIGVIQRLRRATPGPASIAAGWLAVAAMAFAAGCSIVGTIWLRDDLARFDGMPTTVESRWSESTEFLRIGGLLTDARPALLIPLGFAIDQLTALMMCMVTIIGTLIFLFAIGYMREELHEVHDHAAGVERRGRFTQFFQYMLLFAFSMLLLLISDNLLQIFVSWELVGVCSFLLIGFYYERTSASTAANKAFIMNRIGDAGFLIGLAIVFAEFGTFNLAELVQKFSASPGAGLEHSLWIVMGLGLFAGCVGKSAQVPLQTWLPDAMEGPTPVSALIHAATMVAAGVYLAARCLPLFAPEVLTVIAWIGAITLLLSAATALVQTDIKRVLAFSTCSQLGYMMLALGLAGWTAGLFHLLTHAFFKALLFLCAGSVICAMHHEQNLLRMGGLRRKMPITAACMLVGVAAIIGVPLFSGWYSKDLILAHAIGNWRHHADAASLALALIPLATVILTAFYMTRLWLLAFAGTPRDQHAYEHTRESPFVMTLPLMILAMFSVAVAWGWPPWNADASKLGSWLHQAEPYSIALKLDEARHHANESHLEAEIAGLACALIGVLVAVVMFAKGMLVREARGGLASLLRERFYFDGIYHAVVTQPTVALSRLFGDFDKRRDASASDLTLDGAFTGAGLAVAGAGARLSPLQTGRIRGYVMALGLTVSAGLAILWYFQR